MKSSGENWRGKDGASSPDTPQAKSGGTDRTHSCPDAPALDKGGCRSLCPRGTRPRRRATSPAASSALPCSPAPPVSRHQSLSVQSGRRPPARRRHFQFFPGCTRTTHNTNKPQAAPAPASLPHPSLPPSPRLRTPRPDASRPGLYRGSRKRTLLAGTRTTQWAERRLWEEREGAGKRAGLLPPRDLIG